MKRMLAANTFDAGHAHGMVILPVEAFLVGLIADPCGENSPQTDCSDVAASVRCETE